MMMIQRKAILFLSQLVRMKRPTVSVWGLSMEKGATTSKELKNCWGYQQHEKKYPYLLTYLLT